MFWSVPLTTCFLDQRSPPALDARIARLYIRSNSFKRLRLLTDSKIIAMPALKYCKSVDAVRRKMYQAVSVT